MNLLGNRILVAPIIAETKRESGIYVPQTVKSQVNKGKVLLVGNTVKPSSVSTNGVEVGQTIIFKEGSGIGLDHEGKQCKIMFTHDIIAIIS